MTKEITIKCERCGFVSNDHYLVNFSDGPFVGRYILLCPLYTFRAKGFDVSGSPLPEKTNGGKSENNL